MGLAAAAAIGIGTGIDAISKYKSGQQAKRIGEINAQGIEEAADLNAQLVEEGTETNAQILEFNAGLSEARSRDAIARGAEEEGFYRQGVKGIIGSQRTDFAGQNVDVGYGSALDIQADTAYQGELNALMLRTSAAREAWGYSSEAVNSRFQAAAQRKLGKLQGRGTRTSGRYDALSSRMGGSSAASAGKYSAAASVLSGAGSIIAIQRQQGTV